MLQTSESIGKLDRRLTLLQPITEIGDSNEVKITGWEEIDDFPQVWGRKQEKQGDEVPLADQMNFAQETNYIIRYRTGLDLLQRVIDKTKVYTVRSINEVNEGRDRYLRISTTIVQNESWP